MSRLVPVRAARHALVLAFALSSRVVAQQTPETTSVAPAVKLPANAAVVPFSVGEKLEYDVKFGPMKVGSGSMDVRDIQDVRGTPSWHTIFRFSGGIPFFKVDDTFESWFDVVTLSSRRHYQDLNEGNYKPRRHYEIFPERGMYQLNKNDEQVSVADPLDDGSMLYYVRTVPLEVGKTYTIPRYFKPEGNPVQITVLRRETIEVPAGKFATVVVQPTFQTKGLFSKNGHAEVWLTDDARRMMVQMKSQLSFGSINLYLRKHNTKTP
jgi:hypothetical protein